MKRLLCMMLALLMTISPALAGCSNKAVQTAPSGNSQETAAGSTKAAEKSEPKKEEAVTLKFMCWDKEENQKPYLDPFAQKYPNIKIEFQYVDNKQYDNVLNTQLAAGEGPDVMAVGAQAKTLANAGYLEDLTNSKLVPIYQESGLDPFKLNGKYYAIPNLSWFEGIFYNKKMFADHGLKPPRSFNEWLDIHETLKKAGIKPQTMGAKSWEPMMKQTIALLLNEFYATDAGKGFDEAFNKGEKTMDGNWNNIVKSWTPMVERGYITKDMLGLDYDQALEEFALEKAAMWECGPWATSTIKQKNPNLQFGMFPIPGLKEGTGWLVGGPGSAWAINSKSARKEAAMTMLEFISTPEIQQKINMQNSGGSFLKGVTLDMGPEYADCSEAFAQGHVYCPWNNWFGAQSIIIEYGKGMQDFLAGDKSIDDVLKAADKKAAEVRKTQNQ